jgi:hypothetical protein
MDIVDCHHHSHSHSHGSYYDKNESTHPNFTAKKKRKKTATCRTNDIWGLPSSPPLPSLPLPSHHLLLPLLSSSPPLPHMLLHCHLHHCYCVLLQCHLCLYCQSVEESVTVILGWHYTLLGNQCYTLVINFCNGQKNPMLALRASPALYLQQLAIFVYLITK